MTGSEQVRRVDVHLACGDRPQRVTTVKGQIRPLPGMEAALFVHEGDLLTRLQGMRQHPFLPHDHEDTFDMGYRTAIADVQDLLRKRDGDV